MSALGNALVAVIWVVGCALLWWRIEKPVVRLLAAMAAQRTPPAREAIPKQETMPVDLLIALRSQESESWAKDDNIKLANELYAKYGDWDKVRAALSYS